MRKAAPSAAAGGRADQPTLKNVIGPELVRVPALFLALAHADVTLGPDDAAPCGLYVQDGNYEGLHGNVRI